MLTQCLKIPVWIPTKIMPKWSQRVYRQVSKHFYLHACMSRFNWVKLTVDREQNKEMSEQLSLTSKLRKTLIVPIKLDSKICLSPIVVRHEEWQFRKNKLESGEEVKAKVVRWKWGAVYSWRDGGVSRKVTFHLDHDPQRKRTAVGGRTYSW